MRRSPRKFCFLTVFREAKKYKTRDEFRRQDQGAWKAMHANPCWKRMILLLHPEATFRNRGSVSVKWTEESLLLEAKKFQTRTTFKRARPAAYKKASQLGILDLIFADHLTWDPYAFTYRDALGNRCNQIAAE